MQRVALALAGAGATVALCIVGLRSPEHAPGELSASVGGRKQPPSPVVQSPQGLSAPAGEFGSGGLEEPVPEAAIGRDLSREAVAPPSFEEKYGGLNDAELANAEEFASEACRLVAEKIFNRLRGEGKVEVTYSSTGEGPFIPSTYSDGSVRLSYWWASPDPNGKTKFEVAAINPSEVPELKSLHAELDWLRHKIHPAPVPKSR